VCGERDRSGHCWGNGLRKPCPRPARLTVCLTRSYGHTEESSE
jgi:hypothetical protein